MKNIGKIKSIIISSVIALCLVAGMILTFIPMSLGNKDYESFAGALSKATSIDGGMSVEYEIDGEYTDKEISNSLKTLTGLISEYGYKSATAYKKGDNKIRIDLNQPVLYGNRSTVEQFLKLLASGKIEFKSKNDATATLTPKEGEVLDPALIIIEGKHIEDISKVNYSQASGVKIDFNKEGRTIYASTVGMPLYMFVGGKAWPSSNNNEISANTDASATSMYLMFNSSDAVDNYYYTLKAGTMEISLDSESVDVVYNQNKTALTLKVASIILTVFIAVTLMVLLAIKTKGFSIAPIVSSLISLAIEFFLLQGMNWVNFGFSSFIGLIVLAIINYLLQLSIYNVIKTERAIGKSLDTATEDGYKKSLWVIIDSMAILLIIGFVLAIATGGEFMALGTVFAMGAVLTAISTLLFNRLINNCIYSLSNKPESFFGLEIKEEE